MPKYGIYFKDEKLNKFLEELQYGLEGLENIEDYPERKSDLDLIKEVESQFLISCLKRYNELIKDLDIVNKNKKLASDARNISLKMIIANRALSRNAATSLAMQALTCDLEDFEKNPSFVFTVSGENGFGAYMEFFNLEFGEEFLSKQITYPLFLSNNLKNKISYLVAEEIKIAEKKKREEEEKLAKALDSEKYLNKIEEAQKAMKKMGKYEDKEDDEKVIIDNNNRILMDLMYRYSRFSTNMIQGERDQAQEKLVQVLMDKGAKEEDAKYRARSILNNPYTDVTNGNFGKTMIKKDMRELLAFFTDLMGKEIIDKSFKDIKFDFSDDLIASLTGEISKPISDEELADNEPLMDNTVSLQDHDEEIQKETIETKQETNITIDNDSADKIEINHDLDENVINETNIVENDTIVLEENNLSNNESINLSNDKSDDSQTKVVQDEPILDNLKSEEELSEVSQKLASNEKMMSESILSKSKEQELENLKLKNVILDNDRYKRQLEEDNDVIKELFGSLDPAHEEFKNRIVETIARLAKGETIFKIQEGHNLKGDYALASRMMLDICSILYPLHPFNKTPRADLASLSSMIYDEVDFELIKNHVLTRKLILSTIDCDEEEKVIKKQLEDLIDKVLTSEINLPSFKEIAKVDSKTIGNLMNEILSCLKENGFVLSKHGLNQEYLLNLGYDNVNGVDVSLELLEKFKYNDLNQVHSYDLKPDEADAIYKKNKATKEYKIASIRLDGFRVKRNYPAIDDRLKDALATYSRLAFIHNNRKGLFALMHSKQNKAEKDALDEMEQILREKYGFTNKDFNESRKNDYNNSLDGIHSVVLSYCDHEAYLTLLEESENRNQARLKEIEKSIAAL